MAGPFDDDAEVMDEDEVDFSDDDFFETDDPPHPGVHDAELAHFAEDATAGRELRLVRGGPAGLPRIEACDLVDIGFGRAA